MKIIKVSPDNISVQGLIAKLDKYQISLYGIVHCHLDSVEELKESKAYMLGAYDGEKLTGIGAVKLFDEYAEIKRMFIKEEYRGKGAAEKLLTGLETYVKSSGINKVCLETGNLQKSALNFYKRLGYSEIESFGSYKPNKVSIFMEKHL